MFPFGLLDTCLLLSLAYHEPARLRVEHAVAVAGVAAEIVAVEGVRLLLVRGPEDPVGWLQRHLMELPARGQGDSGLWWHGGFLDYARVVYGFAKERGCAAVAGHSLGAAVAQIVGPSLALPTLAVASPRPLLSERQPQGHELVQNILRSDDRLAALPPAACGYRHVGSVSELRPPLRHRGEDHRIEHYIALLREYGGPPLRRRSYGTTPFRQEPAARTDPIAWSGWG